MGSTTFVIPSVFTAIDKFSGPMKGMGNAVQGFVGRTERLMGRANMAFSKLISPLTSINKLLMGFGVYLGLFTLIRIMKNAIDIFADFQQANVDLSVVMGVTVSQNKILADNARRIGLAYGVAATEVVRMQHALATLGFDQDDIMKMGRPMITGSAALEGANPEKLADIVGAMVNTFDKLAAGDTQHILDVMALSANRTALNFEKLATTLPIVAGPANALGISFEQVVALLGTLSNAGVHVATSATSLKNIFIDSQKRGHTYAQMLDNVAKNTDKLTYAYNKFGKRSVVSALVLAQKLKETAGLQKELETVRLGLTEDIAIQRINTFRGAQKLLNATYQEFILSIEDGNGPISEALIRYMKTASAVLLLLSYSDQAKEALGKMDSKIVDTANTWLFWLKVLKWVAIAIISTKVILMAAEVALVAYKAVSWAIVAATKALTAAQWLWNAAMAANPIGLIVIATAALLALLTSAVMKFNEWGAAVLFLIGPLGWLPLLFTTIAKHWNLVVEAFSNGGILAGIKAIGATIADLILYPLQQILEIIHNLTGLDWAASAASGIEAFRIKIGAEEDAKTVTPIVNPRENNEQNSFESWMANMIKGNVNLNINDPGGHVKDVKSDSSFVTPRLGTTNTFGR